MDRELLDAEVDDPGGIHRHRGDSQQFVPQIVECFDGRREVANPFLEFVVKSDNRRPETSDSNVLVVDPKLGYVRVFRQKLQSDAAATDKQLPEFKASAPCLFCKSLRNYASQFRLPTRIPEKTCCSTQCSSLADTFAEPELKE